MWRLKNGLAAVYGDHNPEKLVDPSLKWVTNTETDIHTIRRANLIKELQKVEGNFDTHKEGQARIENRENCIVRLTFKGLDTVTKNMRTIKEARAKELVDDMTRKFGD